MWTLPSACLLVFLLTCQLKPSTSVGLPDLGELFRYWSGQSKDDHVEEIPLKQHVRTKRQSSSLGDSSQIPHEAESPSLPVLPGTTTINDRYMPALSNGLIATTVYSNTLYVNGLYSGAGADSHRADVPALVMTRVDLGDAQLERDTVRRYKFNAKQGVFTETIDCPFAYIEHRTYVHSKYIRVLVTDIEARRKDGQYGGVFKLSYSEMNTSKDIQWEAPVRYESEWKVTGRTKAAERDGSVTKVHVFYFTRSYSISLRSTPNVRETIIMSADIVDSTAKSDFDSVRRIISGQDGPEKLLNEHITTWEKTWERGRIDVYGDLNVAKITAFSQYYLMSQFPSPDAANPPQYNAVLHGFARTSLAKGGENKDYRGHTFWDSEMYLLPAYVLFRPDIAKAILRYRSAYAGEAQKYAADTNHEGYRFPWESATTGSDVTPDACIACRDRAYHVTAGIGWAIRQYYSATRDKDYMTNPDYNGCDMTREIARFWAEKAVYNTSKGRYDINDVMGPDDWHPKVNNNAYTNVMASLAIHWGRYFACLCERNERNEVPDEWISKALYLDLPYDNVKRLHYQYEGFDSETNRTHKQADTIMLSYPIGWNMSVDIMRNDLMFYELYTADRTPAMTHSFYTVGWKWVKEEAKMINSFLKSYQDYTIQPFKVWTEYNERTLSDQEESSVNYLPGMGGFLQSLVYGFAGIRIRPEFMEFHRPTPPPNCDRMIFTGFKYLGAVMNIEIQSGRVVIDVIDSLDHQLMLQLNSSQTGEKRLTPGSQVIIDKPEEGFYILANKGETCDHPRDYIFMPWGYSPWISSAPQKHVSLLLASLIFIASLLFSDHLSRLTVCQS